MNRPHEIRETREIELKIIRVPVYCHNGTLDYYTVTLYANDSILGFFGYNVNHNDLWFSEMYDLSVVIYSLIEIKDNLSLQEQIIKTYFDM